MLNDSKSKVGGLASEISKSKDPPTNRQTKLHQDTILFFFVLFFILIFFLTLFSLSHSLSLSLSLNLSISQSLSFSNFLSLSFSISLILPFSLPHSIHLSIYLSIHISIYLSLHLQVLHFFCIVSRHFSAFFAVFFLSFFSSFNHLSNFLMLVSGLSDIWLYLTLSVLLEWVVCLNEGFVVVPGGKAPLDPPLLHPIPPSLSFYHCLPLTYICASVCAYL